MPGISATPTREHEQPDFPSISAACCSDGRRRGAHVRLRHATAASTAASPRRRAATGTCCTAGTGADTGASQVRSSEIGVASGRFLQNGDETNARTALEKAVVLDPSNDLAKKLLDQIKADAQAELGSTFFRYTVQRDDSLSKLAQTYLGDRFRFYILAKYNEISNPSRLSAGQVIKIPGKGPIAPPVTARPAPTKPPETVEVAPKPARPRLSLSPWSRTRRCCKKATRNKRAAIWQVPMRAIARRCATTPITAMRSGSAT
jgi:LysM repeat protein